MADISKIKFKGVEYNIKPLMDTEPTTGSTNAVQSGGVYEALHNTDTTLSQSGQAADAKVVGDEIGDIKEGLNNLPTFGKQDFVPNPAESERYDFIICPKNASQIYLTDFATLDTAKFDVTTTGSGSVTASDGRLHITTGANETGKAMIRYNQPIDASIPSRYSFAFNYEVISNTQLSLFRLFVDSNSTLPLHIFLNRTNKIRIHILDANLAVKFIQSDGTLSDSAQDAVITVGADYVLDVAIIDGKIGIKIYKKDDGTVLWNSETSLSLITSFDGANITIGKNSTSASTAVNLSLDWFQHDENEVNT